jgi:hypothetical protein
MFMGGNDEDVHLRHRSRQQAEGHGAHSRATMTGAPAFKPVMNMPAVSTSDAQYDH